MKILILDQHSDLTRSLLQQFGELGHECFLADSSIRDLPKWAPDALLNANYMYPFQVGCKQQLLDGYFDAILVNNMRDIELAQHLIPAKTKRIYFNGNRYRLDRVRLPKNVLSQDLESLQTALPSSNKSLFVVSLPEIHTYHGPNVDGNFIQLIFDFTRIASRNDCSNVFARTFVRFSGKRKIIAYGDPDNVIKDLDAFPNMYCLLHIKNWGAGMDYSLAKAMSRGIPAILYEPYLHKTICTRFINRENAFIGKDVNDLLQQVQIADNDADLVIEKGKRASRAVNEFMSLPKHKENLKTFLDNLI